MGKAIKITAKKAPEVYDLGASKFFGTPTVPLAWNGDFYDDELAPYKQNSNPSTSRDPDSDEWKK